MNLIDKVILEWSFRTKKGYPDLNSKEDLKIFESTFGFNLKEEISFQNSIKAAQYIADSPEGKQNDVKAFKSGKYRNRINLLTIKDPSEVKTFLGKVFNIDSEEIQAIPPRQEGNPSDTYFAYNFDSKKFGDVQITVSTGKKGTGGKDNEQIVLDKINSVTQGGDPVNVTLEGKNGPVHFKGVTGARDASQETKAGAKADVQLLGDGKVVGNISIKEDKGFRWASIGGLLREFRQKFIDKALNDDSFPISLIPNPESRQDDRYLMVDNKTGERVTKIVVENFPAVQDPIFIFGTDDPKTVIAGQNFRDEHFDYNESTNTLTIQTVHIFTDMDQIKGSDFEPKFTIEQHKGQKYGLDFRIVPAFKARLSAAGRTLDYSKIK